MDLPLLNISYKWILQYVTFYVWLLSLRIILSRLPHVGCVRTCFLFVDGEQSIIHAYHRHLSILASADTRVVSTFWPLWIVLLWTFVLRLVCGHVFCSLGYILRSGNLGSYVVLYLAFWGTTQLLVESIFAKSRITHLEEGSVCHHLAHLVLGSSPLLTSFLKYGTPNWPLGPGFYPVRTDFRDNDSLLWNCTSICIFTVWDSLIWYLVRSVVF